MNLAINGGKKLRSIPFPKHPIIGEEEKRQVLDVLDSGNISTFIASPGENFLGGKKIKEFEEKFSKKIGTKFGVAFNSASSALHAAVVSVGVNPGDEVICVAAGFPTTMNPILQFAAVPVFVDIELGTYNIDPTKIEAVVTNKTKAIVLAHSLGNPFNLDMVSGFLIERE